MNTINIYTNPELVKEISKYIHENFKTTFLTIINRTCYYNVNGIVWEVYQNGYANYPTTSNIKVENFKY